MADESNEISATAAFCVHPSQPWLAGHWHTSDWVTLPAGCVSVRGTVTPVQPAREDPRLGCEVALVFRGAGEDNIVRGHGCHVPARNEFDPDEPIPQSNHELGQPPGVLPSVAGRFFYVTADSPAVQQGPYRAKVAVRFRLTLGDAETVVAGVAIEAIGANDAPLEIV